MRGGEHRAAVRPVRRHGMPPALLTCEFRAVGMEPARIVPLAGDDIYFAAFRIARARPAPGAIKRCKL